MDQDAVAAAIPVETEDRAPAIGAASVGRAVEHPVAGLHQSGIRVQAVARGAEMAQDAVGAPILAQHENRSRVVAAAVLGRAVEHPICPFDQAGQRPLAVAGGEAGKAVQDTVTSAILVQLEHCAHVAGAAIVGRAVEGPVAPLDERGRRTLAIQNGKPKRLEALVMDGGGGWRHQAHR